MLNYISEAYESLNLDLPKIILTHKEPALYNAIDALLPATKHMICIWHINQNILRAAKPHISAQVDEDGVWFFLCFMHLSF